jgi:hypothetical protein
MGYLNNQVVTIDAILTKKGRELLAAGSNPNGTGFNITQFALADDEIDYTMYNPTHPSGSAYYGEAIENMPLLEAFPDGTQIMKSKLITLPRGTSQLPSITLSTTSYTIQQNSTQQIIPSTSNYITTNESSYQYTISDVRVFSSFIATGAPSFNATSNPAGFTSEQANPTNALTISNGTNISATAIGKQLSVTGTGVNLLFGSTTSLYSTLTIIGMDSGARLQVPITISKITSTSAS